MIGTWILSIFGPPIGALILAALTGFIQLGVYKLFKVKTENIPIFPILAFRGLLFMLALIAVATIAVKMTGIKFWEDPLLSPEAQKNYQEMLDPEIRQQKEKEKEEAWYAEQERLRQEKEPQEKIEHEDGKTEANASEATGEDQEKEVQPAE